MTARSTDGQRLTTEALEFVPELRSDLERRDIDHESVVWSPRSPEPLALNALGAVMLDVIDGEASISQLATEVHEEIGVPLETAQRQLTQLIDAFARARLLTSSDPNETIEPPAVRRDLFVAASTPCSENASRLGTTTVYLRLDGEVVRVACDSPRAARTVRDALADHIVDEDDGAPLAFVLTAPQGLRRTHRLVDRAGFVLSEGRGLDSGLHALASHLTGLLPPAAGVARIQARAVVTDHMTVVCLFPLLYAAVLDERTLERAGLGIVDRLAVDIDIHTGEIANPAIPWPDLDRGPGKGHVGTGGTRRATAVLVPTGPPGTPPPTRGSAAAALAASGLRGSRAELLDAAFALVRNAEVHSSSPEQTSLLELLTHLSVPRA